jgi:hypothetical protein
MKPSELGGLTFCKWLTKPRKIESTAVALRDARAFFLVNWAARPFFLT